MDARWAEEGDVGPGSVSAVLHDLAERGETGMLEVLAEGRVFRLALRRGVPIHASSGLDLWLIGHVIEHLGEPIGGGVAALRRVLARASGRSGDELVRAGVTSRDCVEQALKEQIRLRAQTFLPLTRGHYRFWRGGEHLSDVPRQPDRWTADDLSREARHGFVPHRALRDLLRRLGDDDPCSALGLPRGASITEARRAFRELARAHHPDRLGLERDAAALDLHRRIFIAAVRAYGRLRER
jgi:hypothetical protein